MTDLIDRLRSITGASGVLTGDDVRQRSDSWPPTGGCQARAVIRPGNTGEVAQVLRACHAERQPVVTHGGVTGLVGATRAGPGELVMSLERMTRLEPVDTVNRTLTVEAGARLQTVQEKAEAADLLFPLDFGARGSAHIGGALSTNAGGNAVIRYGMARAQVLGLEAVLADGTIVSSMQDVIKNNTGYDLKQLFIGSEGTLGIITRAVLRLRPLPRSQNTALVAIGDFDRLAAFLRLMDQALGGTLSAFEVMWNDFYSLLIGDGSRFGTPLDTDHPFYVLLESTGGHPEGDADRFEQALQEAFDADLIADAALAQSKQQRADLWAIRDDIPTLVSLLNPPLAFDVSLAIGAMPEYVERVRSSLLDRWPQARMTTFGHLGDGNIHLVISVGSQEPADVQAVEQLVYGPLEPHGGVISAEHGIGLDKRPYLQLARSPEEIALMRTLKQAIDPRNILNPGRVLPPEEADK